MSGARQSTTAWWPVCNLDEVLPETGVAALIDGRQVAIFRVRDAVYALDNRDPASDANVLARGIIGDVGGELVVASPIYKQHYSLISGRCLENPALSVPAYLTRVLDSRIWVRAAAMRFKHGTSRQRLVVIGNGPAARRTLEELLGLSPRAYDITLFDAEPQGGYDRVLLSSLLAGDKRREELITHPPQWYAERDITLHMNDAIEHVDRAQRRVRSRRGVEIGYDRLLLATGSQPIRPDIAGQDLAGVITFRTLQDVDTMLAATHSGSRAIVIGGGLLGLEAASGLASRDMQVTLIHQHEHLMERQLDAVAARMLQQTLQARLTVRLATRVEQVLGSERVRGVRLSDQSELAAELVVLAVGVLPQIDLARRIGLACDRGVLVDDTLQTYDPAIYAVGECVQHRGQTFGLVAPLWEQARVCAAHLAQRGARRYLGSTRAAQLRVGGLQVFSVGDHSPGPGREALTLRDPVSCIYKRLVLERDRVRGAVLYGDARDGEWYRQLISEGRDVSGLRDRLLFGAQTETGGGA